MTLKRFKEIWEAAGRQRMKFEASPHLMNALLEASRGNFSYFDKIEHLLAKHDSKERTINGDFDESNTATKGL